VEVVVVVVEEEEEKEGAKGERRVLGRATISTREMDVEMENIVSSHTRNLNKSRRPPHAQLRLQVPHPPLLLARKRKGVRSRQQ